MKHEDQIIIEFLKGLQTEALRKNIQDLGQQLSNLNTMLSNQNAQLNSSLNQSKEHLEGVRKEFEKFNTEMDKTSSFFERLENTVERLHRSSTSMERLTRVIISLTVAGTFFGAYSMTKDFVASPGYALIPAFAAMVVVLWLIIRNEGKK